jgi:hypothetical protein
MTAKNIWRLCKTYGRLIGCPELKPHDLRHGVAMEVLEQQHDLEQVRALLGPRAWTRRRSTRASDRRSSSDGDGTRTSVSARSRFRECNSIHTKVNSWKTRPQLKHGPAGGLTSY